MSRASTANVSRLFELADDEAITLRRIAFSESDRRSLRRGDVDRLLKLATRRRGQGQLGPHDRGEGALRFTAPLPLCRQTAPAQRLVTHRFAHVTSAHCDAPRSCFLRGCALKGWKEWLVPPVLFPALLVVGIAAYAIFRS